ncbi:hypothetical protein [Amnibacterium endophyticum]|uniref:Uncharacterized protein n=1 Tax=Amnibacterium endophyticum TaxID=2109337 RepID=A0ABW4LF34_9MICO
MADLLLRPSPALRPSSGAIPARTVLTAGLVVSLTALLVALIGLAVDPRSIGGAPAWLKPMKFAVSVSLYLLTLRLLLPSLDRFRRRLGTVAVVLVSLLAAELVLIDLQVVRGTTSHFNERTPFDAAVYYGMGGMVSVVFLATAVVAVMALRSRGTDRGVAAGVRWGLLLALVGMAEAVLMTVNFGWQEGGGHTVGAADGGPGMPITDWSLLHGDLRIGHFLGLHALQVLPVLAVLLARIGLPEQMRRRLATVAGAGYLGAIALVTWQALRGEPLVAPSAATLIAAATLLAVVLLGVVGVLVAERRRELGLRATR